MAGYTFLVSVQIITPTEDRDVARENLESDLRWCENDLDFRGRLNTSFSITSEDDVIHGALSDDELRRINRSPIDGAPNRWVIRSSEFTNEKNELLYYCSINGWVERDDCTIYSKAEKENSDQNDLLPMGGFWESA